MMDAVTKMREASLDTPQVPAVVTPMAMIDRAIAGGASIETLERLMALQERWETSEAKREFDEAISSAKAAIKPIIKNRRVGFDSKKAESGRTEYAYEDLAQIAETVDPILADHGLSYRYQSRQDGQAISVTCIISHRRGHREETTLQAGADNSGAKNAIQAIGSAVTYLQRYTLKLALGLAASPDTDGNSVTADAPKTIDAAQYRYLQELIEKADTTEELLSGFLKVDGLEGLSQVQFKKAETTLRGRIAAAKGK